MKKRGAGVRRKEGTVKREERRKDRRTDERMWKEHVVSMYGQTQWLRTGR